MAHTRTLSAVSLVALACSVLFTAGCVPGVRESTVADGEIHMPAAAVGKAEAYAAGKGAAEALKKQLGSVIPKAVLMVESFEEPEAKKQALEGVGSVFPATLVFGMATYGCFGQGGCLRDDAVGLMAIGGQGISVATALERQFGVAKLAVEKDEAEIETRLHAAGARLAGKLKRRDDDRLLILLADAHSPKNQFLVEGVQKVFGDDFPIVGGCANKRPGQTYVYYRGQMFEDSGVALLLSGNFQVGLAGRMAKENDRVIATAKEAAAEALANAKGKPIAAFAFNCAGRMGRLKNVEDELAAMRAALGDKLPLFGCYCAGEIGPPDKAEKKPGVLSGGTGWHVMFAILGR